MKVTILGAGGGEVTGSAYLLQTKTANVLIDCGMYQGASKSENYRKMPKSENVKKLDCVILTHAHLDHTGRLPLLTKLGYRHPIYATPATIELTEVILKDSARLQRSDAERENRKRKRFNEPPLDPLYSEDDVTALKPLMKTLTYDKPTEIAPGVTVRAVEAGHMLGSASLEFTVEEAGKKRVIIFSGDIGPRGAPLHHDPVPFKHADVVFMESTYGDRNHKSLKDSAIEARENIKQVVKARGKILVPVFAVARSQLIMYLLAGAFHKGTLKPFPIYIDSPMAIEATRIYRKHVELFDAEALSMQKSGDLRANLESVEFCKTAEESKALNDVSGPCMILAGSGMCTGGRILHHFKYNLAIPGTLVMIVGFQSHGSLGRMLVDGAKHVTIFGERIPVRAKVITLNGMSGHAGQKDLMNWYDSLASSRPRTILTHGENKARTALARLIREKHQVKAELPELGDVIEID
ncbi:MAG: MBL fold metallo-hydrolase [Planctomycetia bacterium]|nr:MBL fold metallo-hydrolase [Planctomycetia bacterium]